MAVTTLEADAVAAAEKAGSARIFVFHNRRFDSDVLLAADILRSGRLGRLTRAEIRMERWAPQIRKKAWKESGEVGSSTLEDLGSHLECRTAVQRDSSRIADAFRISLEYPGFWVDLEASLLVRRSAVRWGLHGTGGSYWKDSGDVQESQLIAGVNPKATLSVGSRRRKSDGSNRRKDLPKSSPRLGATTEGSTSTLRRFLTREPSRLFSWQAGAEVVRLLELARQSAVLAQTVPNP